MGQRGGSLGAHMGVGEYREFIELARCLNFTEAADRLEITQPALSKHIAALEREFGTMFFDRDRRGLVLTETGKVMLGAATAIVDAYESARQSIDALNKRRPIRVGGALYDDVVSSIVSLTSILLDGDEGPRVVATGNEGRSFVGLLMNDEIDATLSYLPPDELALHGLKSRPLIQVQFVAIVDAGNPIADRDELHVDDLRDETLIQLVDEYANPGWKRIREVCLAHGFEPKKRPMVGDPASYASIIPEDAVYVQQRNLRQNKLLQGAGNMRLVPIVDDDAYFKIDCIFRKADEERLAPFLDALEEARDIIARHGGGRRNGRSDDRPGGNRDSSAEDVPATRMP